MQKHRPPSFLHTNTTALHHGLWLGWMAPPSSISFHVWWVVEFFRTSPWRGHHQQLWSHVLLGLYSWTLQAPRKRCLGIQLKVHGWLLEFCQTTTPGQIKSSCWKSTSLLHSTNILVCWIPCISSSFSKVPAMTFTWGTVFAATTWATLMLLVIVIGAAIRFFHHDCTSITPSSLFGVGIYDTQTLRQAGSITPLHGLHHYIHVLLRSMVFIWLCTILDKKNICLFPLYHSDILVQVSWIHGLVCSFFASNGKFCLMACQEVGYCWPIQGSQQLIYFTIFDHIDDSIEWNRSRTPRSISAGLCQPLKSPVVLVVWYSYLCELGTLSW